MIFGLAEEEKQHPGTSSHILHFFFIFPTRLEAKIGFIK